MTGLRSPGQDIVGRILWHILTHSVTASLLLACAWLDDRWITSQGRLWEGASRPVFTFQQPLGLVQQLLDVSGGVVNVGGYPLIHCADVIDLQESVAHGDGQLLQPVQHL